MYTLRYALVSVMLLFFGLTKVNSQVTEVDFLVQYNPETCMYEACMVIVTGSATTYPERIQFNAQYTLVVPTGTTLTIDTLFWPKENNATYTGTIPCLWEFGPVEVAPPTMPTCDYYTVFPNLSPPSAYNNLMEGDTVRLFGVSTNDVLPCEFKIRPFEVGLDPPSIDMPSGGDFQCGTSVGGPVQDYRANLETKHPPLPDFTYDIECNGDITINAEPLDSFVCQHPYGFQWTGPAGSGFFSSDQSPVIPEPIMPGLYEAFITDAYGCDTTIYVQVDGVPLVTSDETICGAGTVTLEDLTGIGTGTWSLDSSNTVGAFVGPTSSGTATATFFANASGDYLFIYSGNGCDAETTVTVAAAASVPDIANNGPLCEGEDLYLTTTTVADSYTWTGPSGSGFSSNQQNPIIFGVTSAHAGTYTLEVTVGGCPSTPATTTVEINPIPPTPTATSNSPVCEGETITLSTSSVSGATYLWTGPNSFMSNLREPTIPNADPSIHQGSYCLTITVDGCESASDCINVTVNPTPSPPSPTNGGPFCEGEDITLFADPVSGTYSWTGPSGFTSNQQNPVIPGADPINNSGDYCLTIIENGCPSQEVCTTVVVNSTPTTPFAFNDGPVCEGEDVQLSTDPVAGATYAWTGPSGSGFTSNQQNPQINGITSLQAGDYCVIVTAGGCSSMEGCTTVALNPTPAPPVVSNDGPTCTGDNLQLFSDPIPGASYSWTGPSGFTSNDQNPIINNVTSGHAGNYCLIITVNGCESVQECTAVTINTTPSQPIVSSNSELCEGETLILDGPTIPGATYEWRDPSSNLFSFDEDPVITDVTLADAGQYCLIVIENGCSSIAGCTDVVINPKPATPIVTSNSPICPGEDILLFTDAVPGATYTWTGPAPSSIVSNDQNPVYSGASAIAGTYCLVVAVDGCDSEEACTDIVIKTTPSVPSISSNTPLCEGSDINLIAGNVPGATYVWSGPNGFSSNDQNPNIPNITIDNDGTYTLYVIVDGCASPTITTDVDVFPTPDEPVPTYNGPICEGEDIELTVPEVPGATYIWSGPITAIGQNQTISGADITDSGTYCVVISLNGCDSPAGCVDVVVNPTPPTPTVSNNSPICEGEDIQLTAELIANAAYAWTGPGTFSSSDQNPIIAGALPAASGDYCLIITVDGCESVETCTSVVVNPTPPTPTVSNNGPICEGEDIQLTAELIANATYAWTGPGTFTSSDQNPIIAGALPAASGDYCLIITVDGCESVETCTNVVVNPTPPTPTVSNNGPICEGEDIQLTAELIANATYAWTGPGTFTSSDQNPIIAGALPAASGDYCLIITVDGCESVETCTSVVVNPTPPTPTVSNNGPICEGEDIQLTAELIANATYAWTGPGTFTSSDQNPIIAGALPAASGDYCLIITVDGCESVETCTNVVVNPTPPTPTVSNNGPICEGEDIQLTAELIANATYAWTGPGTFTSSDQNPIIAGALPAASGDYCLIITVDGCESVETCTNVVVNPTPPTPTVSNNGPICEGEDIQLTAELIANATYAWTGPGTFTSSDQNPIMAGALPAASGDYCLIITVDGCESVETCTNVVVNPTPPTPTVSNNGPICEGEDIQLTAELIANATYAWTGPGTFTSSDQNPIIAGALPAASGDYCLIITVDGCESVETCTNVVVNPTPPTPTVSNNGPICEGEDIQLTAELIANATYAWTGPGTFTSSDQNPIIAGALPAASGDYCLIITVDGCESVETCTSVVVNPTPPTPTVSNNGPICEGEDIQLTAELIANATYAWTGPGTFTSSDQNPIIAGALPSSSGDYCLIITVDGCESVETCTNVVVNPTPPTPTVSNNGPICEGEDIQLTAELIANATYAWTGPGTFTSSDQNPIIAGALPAASGDYCLIITVDGCESVETCTSVVVNPTPPTPTVSNNGPICEGEDIQLTAELIANATYAWTGPGTFTSSDQNPIIAGALPAASGDYCLIITVDGCESVETCTNVVVNPTPPTPTVSNNGPICEGEDIQLTAELIANATYAWTGPGTFTSSDQNPIIAGALPAASGDYCLIITVDGCESVETCTNVVVYPTPPTPTVSNNGPICEGEDILLTAETISGATYAWSGPLGFSSNDQNPTVFSALPAASGDYCLIITVDGCESVEICTNVTVYPTPPTPFVDNNGPICEGEDILLTAETISGATYAWSGPLGFSSNDQNPTVFSALPAASGDYCLIITVDGCESVEICTNVTVYPTPPTPFVSNNGPICEGEDILLTAETISGATYAWSGPLGFTSNDQNPTVFSALPAASGDYCLIVIVDGCESVEICTEVTVYPTPPTPIISNNGPVCESETIDLSGETISGASYAWSGPLGFSSNDQNPSISNAIPGMSGDYCLIIIIDGCESAEVCTDVTVYPTPPTPTVSNNGPVCEGETIELSGETISGASYTWSGPLGYTSNDQNPSISNATPGMSGNYCLIITIDGCESAEVCTDVTVYPTPPTPTVSNNGPVCEGETIELSGETISGASYTWSGPLGYTSNDQNPSISNATPGMSGNYCLIITIDGCESAEVCTDVTVYPTPPTPTVSNNGPVCEGETIELSGETISGASYTWSGPLGYTSNDQNPSISNATPGMSGNYCLIITIDGCESAEVCTDVTVYPTPPTPTVSNNGPVCEGETIELTGETISGASYTWSGPLGFTSNDQNPSISNAIPGMSGNYCLIITIDGCESAEVCTDVTVYPTPPTPTVSNNGPVCEGETIELTGETISGASYAWSGPLGFSSADQNPSISNAIPGMSGDYCLIITIDGCESAEVCTDVTVYPTPPTPTVSNNGPVCEGETIELTGETISGASYAWSGPLGFSSADQNPSISNAIPGMSGDYCLIITIDGCESAEVCTDVTVYPTPQDPVISSNSPICEGANIELMAEEVSGASYAWSGPLGFTSNDQNPSISNATPGMSGDYCLIITIDGCESMEVCTDVTVYPTPPTPVVSNNGPLCEGESIELSVESVPNATYAWTGPNDFSSNAQNPSIADAVEGYSGSYCVIITVDGCESMEACTDVDVLPTPSTPMLTNNGPLCEGEDLEILASTIPNADYAWTGPNDFSSTDQNINITGASIDDSGNYCLIITIDGCVSEEVCTEVIIKENPQNPDPSYNGPICEGADLELLTSSVVDANYAWTGPGAFSSNEQNPIIENADQSHAGTYCLIVSVDGCESEEVCIEVEIKENPETPVATNSTPSCEGEDLQLFTSEVNGATYAWTGPLGFTSSDQNPIIPAATPANDGEYCVVITVDGCESEAGCTIVEVTPALSAGDDQEILCAVLDDIVISMAATAANNGSWSTGSNQPSVSFSDINSPTTTITNITAAGNYTFIWGDGICSDTMEVVVTEMPNAGEDQYVKCDQIGSAIMAAEGNGSWSWGSTLTATIVDEDDPNSIITDFSAPGTYELIWTVGDCTDSVILTVDDDCDCPIVNNLIDGTPSTYCGESDARLITGQEAEPAGGVYTWQYRFNDAPVWQDLGFSTQDYTTQVLGIGKHEYRRIYEIDTPICSDTSNITLINVLEQPDAGADQNLTCVDLSTFEVTMAGTGTGNWNLVSGDGSATIISGNNANTVISDFTSAGTYTFSFGGVECTDEVVITITEAVNAGPDQSAECFATDSAVMSATPNPNASWSWGSTDGNQPTFDFDDPNAVISGFSINGTYELIWTDNVTGCSDAVLIIVGDDCDCPIDNNTIEQPDPNQFCGTSPAIEIIGSSATPEGEYLWEYDGGSGFGPAPGVNDQQNYTTINLGVGTHRFRRNYTTTVEPICNEITNTVEVIVHEQPEAGEDLSIDCIELPGGSVNMNGALAGTWSPLATNLGSASIADVSDLTTEISNFTEPGTYGFVLTNEICSDTVYVSVTEAMEAGADQSVECYVTGNAVLAASSGNGTWSVGVIPAGATDPIIASPGSPNTSVDGFDIDGTYELIWTDIATGCSDAVNIVVGDDCSCPISGNNVIQPNSSEFCDESGIIIIDGAEASPSGGSYLWEYEGANGFESAEGLNTNEDYETINLGVGVHTFRRIYTIDTPECSDTSGIVTITVWETPDAGADQILDCIDLPGTTFMAASGNGLWSANNGNPSTVNIVDPNSATTEITGFAAVGEYVFSYDNNGCADEVSVFVTEAADAGSDVSVNCFLTGTASLSAVGSGTWSYGTTPGDQPTFVMNNANTTISGFAQAGVYELIWTTDDDCTDTVLITVGDDCACPIGGNVLTAPSTDEYCDMSPDLTINGEEASPAGGAYVWEYSFNGGAFSAASNANDQEDYSTGVLGVGEHCFRRIYNLDSPECSDTSNVVCITVLEQPNAGEDQTIECVETQTNITMAGAGSGTWIQDPLNPNVVTIDDPSSATTSMSGLISGTYVFILENGICIDEVTITVTEEANAGADLSFDCYETATAVLSASGTGSWSWNSTLTATISDLDDANATISDWPSEGVYELIWTNGDGCEDSVTITIGDDCDCPITGNIINQLDPVNYCGETDALIITGNEASPSGGTYVWLHSYENGAFGPAPTPNNARDYTTSLLAVGKHRFRRVYTIASPVSCADTSNIVTINIAENANAGPDQTVDCFLEDDAVMAAIGSGSWSWSSTNTATIVSPNEGNSVITDWPAPGTYVLTWTTDDNCTDEVSIVVGNDCACPIENNTINQPIENEFCGESPVITITGSVATPSGGSYLWEYSTDNVSWSDAIGINTNQDYETIVLGVGEHFFRRTYSITNPVICDDISNVISIVVYEEADAGPDQAVDCYENGVATMAATGDGQWSWSSADTATIANVNNENTSISGWPSAGTYVLIWTTEDGCTDEVSIVVGDNCACPIENNTIDQPIENEFCGASPIITIIGSVATPSGGTYLWEYSDNNIDWMPANGINTMPDYDTEVLGVGTHRFRRVYSIDNPIECDNTSNVVVITVYEDADAGADQTVDCYEDGIATMAAMGDGEWSWSSTLTATIDSPADPNSTVSGFPQAGTYELTWTTEDGSCTDVVSIVVGEDCACPIENNTIEEPIQSEFCGASPVVIIIGSIATPSGGSYLWEYSDNNIDWTPANGINTMPDYETEVLGVGTHRFRRVYSIDTPIECDNTSNVVVITVYEAADAGADQTVDCYEDGVATMAATGTGQWSWSSTLTATIDSPADPNSTISGFPQAGTYELIWTTDDGGCTDIATIIVGGDCVECEIMNNVIDQPIPSDYCEMSPEMTIVGGTALPLGGNYTWEYSFNGAPFSAASGTMDQQSYTTADLGPGNHRFRRVYSIPNDPTCEDVSDIVEINVMAPVEAGEDQDLGCQDINSIEVTMAANGVGSWTQPLSNPSQIDFSSLNDANAVLTNFGAPGLYTFIWTNAMCEDEMTVLIEEIKDAGADRVVDCYIDGSVMLNGEGNGTWSMGENNPGSFDITSLNDPNAALTNFTIDGVYELIWTVDGCSDNLFITVDDSCPCLIEANAIVDDLNSTYCNTTGQLMVIGEDAQPAGGAYLWQISINGSGFSNAPGVSNERDYLAADFGEGTYKLRRQYTLNVDGIECDDISDEVDFYVFDKKASPGEITFTPNPVCVGDSLLLEVTFNPDLTYNWEIMSGGGRLLYSLDSMSMIVVERPGKITVSVTQYLEGCDNNLVSTASTIDINVLDTPKPDLGRDTTFCELDETFIINPGDFVEYEWHDGSTAQEFEVEGEGIYTVSVIDSMGCVGHDMVNIKSFCCEFAYPNIFKADSYGKNSSFIVTDIYDCVIEAEIFIYDRWGNLVYVGDGLESWDGTFKGKFVEQGVYVFIYKYKAMDADRQEFEDSVKGDITVLR